MNKIIAFLGAEKYDPTTYYYEGARSNSTCYLLGALACQFYPEYAIRLLCTKEAKNQHLAALRHALGEDVSLRLRHEPVKEIATENDLWEIFEVIQHQVEEGDNIVFDITHSFRALPFLAFLVLAYLRVIRKFTITAVIYAPYAQHERSEVYNIREFVELLDWIIAANLFTKTGFAAPMADLLQGHDWGSSKANPADLDRVTAALRLARPDEARQAAYALTQSLTDVESDAPRLQLRPFEALLDRIKTEFTQIAPVAPDPNDLRQELEQELAFVSWNLERGQLLSAVTVACEWLVSLMCWYAAWTGQVREKDRKTDQERDVREWQSKRGREKARSALNALSRLMRHDVSERQQCIRSYPLPAGAHELWRNAQTRAEDIGKVWNQISDLRNDLDHAGKVHTTTPRSLVALIKEVQQVPGLLQPLFE